MVNPLAAELFVTWREKFAVPAPDPNDWQDDILGLTSALLESAGFVHDDFDDPRLSDLRATVQGMVEILEHGSGPG